jgi:hypothetical protein
MTAAPDVDLARYHLNVNKLCSIALARLPRMIDPASGLVVFRLGGEALAPAGTSVRYTAITALGVERADAHGLSPTIDLEKLYEALSATLAGVDNAGDLGLVLWASARNARPLAERALRDLLEFKGNVRHRGGAIVHSTDLAWIVTGLAEALAAGVGPEREVKARLDRAFRQLLSHRGASGLLCFARPLDASGGGDLSRWSRKRPQIPGPSEALKRTLHAQLGFFDAQVYAIVAALRRDAVVGDPEARAVARRIGELLLAHQHPLGQWGWHYNVRSGGLVDLYPVYSVHQDGMAPMALLALESALGVPTTAAVARGVHWLFGRNELRELMAINERALIWRSIRRRAPFRFGVYPLKAASLAGAFEGRDLGARLAADSMLEVDRELRPYHLGFCLYAFAEIAAAVRALGAPAESEAKEALDQGAPPQETQASNRV